MRFAADREAARERFCSAMVDITDHTLKTMRHTELALRSRIAADQHAAETRLLQSAPAAAGAFWQQRPAAQGLLQALQAWADIGRELEASEGRLARIAATVAVLDPLLDVAQARNTPLLMAMLMCSRVCARRRLAFSLRELWCLLCKAGSSLVSE